MTLLGAILLILGLVFAIKILWIIGMILLIIGTVLILANLFNHTSRHYW